MVRAILAGRKVQTRRLLDPLMYLVVDGDETTGRVVNQSEPSFGALAMGYVKKPYAERGDRLWVKETWRPSFNPGRGLVVRYDADASERVFGVDDVPPTWTMPKAAARGNVTPLFMPRWASRLTLEVSDVRVERLHDISASDVVAEGIDPARTPGIGSDAALVDAYRQLWDSINGERAPWASNPWLWVVSFRRLP